MLVCQDPSTSDRLAAVTLEKLAIKARLGLDAGRTSPKKLEKMLETGEARLTESIKSIDMIQSLAGLTYLNPLVLFEALAHAAEVIDADLFRRVVREVERLRQTRATQPE